MSFSLLGQIKLDMFPSGFDTGIPRPFPSTLSHAMIPSAGERTLGCATTQNTQRARPGLHRTFEIERVSWPELEGVIKMRRRDWVSPESG
jgi:hypothetical protein